MKKGSLPVARPTLSPLDLILPHLEKVWESRVVTNCGPYHEAFEEAVAEYLDIAHVTLVSNATLGLMLAFKALGLTGEVITTPFSFIATANALHWAGLKPVFADIESSTLNLDPVKVKEAITVKTSAVLPVHIFGRVCDVASFAKLSRTHGLSLVYDAAQAFGVRSNEQSVLDWGDISVLSFHATKVFNSIEGGLIVSHDAATKKRLDVLRNNGIDETGGASEIGLNAKMSEIHAAIGLVQLQTARSSIEKLWKIERRYREALQGSPGIRFVDYPQGQSCNHGYFPIIVEKEYGLSRDALWKKLEDHGVLARRYFYPLIPDQLAYRDSCSFSKKTAVPVATRISESIICLPMFADMTRHEFERIVNVILK